MRFSRHIAAALAGLVSCTGLAAIAAEKFNAAFPEAPEPNALPSGDVRWREHRNSVRKIRQLHFFREGGGMHLSPQLYRTIDKTTKAAKSLRAIERKEMVRSYGMVWNPNEPDPVGLFDVQYKSLSVGVLGCVACHSGRAAGYYIMGIGNKNIDTYAIGRTATRVEEQWNKIIPRKKHLSPEELDSYRSALEFSKTLSVPSYMNQVQGLVPTSTIHTWFYKQAKQELPEGFKRGAVKVPHFFGYAEKRKVGQFCDGFGDGTKPGWGAAVELTANQKPEVVASYMHEMEQAEQLIGKLLPPKYPFFVSVERAERGKEIYRDNCMHCHGKYETDPAGLPIYVAPKLIPWARVETDSDRLEMITSGFRHLVEINPLPEFIRATTNSGGYFAPRLHAVWARFPYLHNGSVPTLYDLLTRPKRRPNLFSLKDAGEAHRFDPERVGLTQVPEKELLKEHIRNERWIYRTHMQGQSNLGHDYGTDLTHEEKLDLIEYLKTL